MQGSKRAWLWFLQVTQASAISLHASLTERASQSPDQRKLRWILDQCMSRFLDGDVRWSGSATEVKGCHLLLHTVTELWGICHFQPHRLLSKRWERKITLPHPVLMMLGSCLLWVYILILLVRRLTGKQAKQIRRRNSKGRCVWG